MRSDAFRGRLAAAFFCACLLGAVSSSAGGCSGWDPRSPFERNAPEVDEAVQELDAGRLEPAERTLASFLGTGPCSADAGIRLSGEIRRLPNGSFDLGLTLFNLGERYGQRFGDEELADGGPADQALAAKRAVEIGCALTIVEAIAADPTVPAELRARARYLAGNLQFMLRKYEEAVREYDKALALVPGLPADAGADGIGRDAAWNRAIALRRIEEQKDAGTDAPDASDGDDGSDGADGSDAADAPDSSDGKDSGDDSGDSGDSGGSPDGGGQDGGGDGGDAGSDGGNDGGSNADGGAPQPDKPQPASPQQQQQDERMLERLERAPSYQQQEARQRAHQRPARPTMEDK